MSGEHTPAEIADRIRQTSQVTGDVWFEPAATILIETEAERDRLRAEVERVAEQRDRALKLAQVHADREHEARGKLGELVEQEERIAGDRELLLGENATLRAEVEQLKALLKCDGCGEPFDEDGGCCPKCFSEGIAGHVKALRAEKAELVAALASALAESDRAKRQFTAMGHEWALAARAALAKATATESK